MFKLGTRPGQLSAAVRSPSATPGVSRNVQDDLAAVVSQLARVEASHAKLERDSERADAEKTRRLDDLAASLGLGQIGDGAYEEEKAKAVDRASDAASTLDSSSHKLAGLRARGLALTEALEAELRVTLDAERSREAAAVAVAEQALAQARERYEHVERRRLSLDMGWLERRAVFSTDAAATLRHRHAAERKLVQWAVHEGGTSYALAQVPDHLHGEVLELVAARRPSAAAEPVPKSVDAPASTAFPSCP
jgi:hypothetical protein